MHYEGRQIALTCTHMGIDPPLLLSALPSEAVGERVAALRAQHGTHTVICSIDLLEGLKGVPLKLLAFEHLLHSQHTPSPAPPSSQSASPNVSSSSSLRWERPKPLRLLLYGITPDARPEDHARVTADVRALVSRINSRFPGAVHFECCAAMPLYERLALLKVTDVLLVTSVREGLNLLPLEYLLTNEANPGSLVVSEFCSLARVLSGAVLCNPWTVRKMSAAIQRALSLDGPTRAARLARDIDWCRSNTAAAWARRMVADVSAAAGSGAERGGGGGLGLGFAWRPMAQAIGMEDGKGFTQLRDEAVISSYHATTRRLIVLDHVGTLVPGFPNSEKTLELHGHPARSPSLSSQGSFSPGHTSLLASHSSFGKLLEEAGTQPQPALSPPRSALHLDEPNGSTDSLPHAAAPHAPTAGAERKRPRAPPPSATVRNALEVVCADSRNTVLVMSTSPREELASSFGSVPGCSLGADNGMYVAWSGLHGRWEMAGGVSWELSEAMQQGVTDEGWRELAMSIVKTYAERTCGAFAECGANYVAFHFQQADPEFGRMQAKELHNHLTEVLRDTAVEVVSKPFRLHVGPRGVDKGSLLRQALNAVRPDFVLVVGDDSTDEPAFSELAEFRSRHAHLANHCYACTVGRKPSRATFFVDDQPAVTGLLEALKWAALRATKSASYADLANLPSVGGSNGGSIGGAGLSGAGSTAGGSACAAYPATTAGSVAAVGGEASGRGRLPSGEVRGEVFPPRAFFLPPSPGDMFMGATPSYYGEPVGHADTPPTKAPSAPAAPAGSAFQLAPTMAPSAPAAPQGAAFQRQQQLPVSHTPWGGGWKTSPPRQMSPLSSLPPHLAAGVGPLPPQPGSAAPHASSPTLCLDPVALASSGCPFIQAPEQAATEHEETHPESAPAASVLLVATASIALLLALRGTLQLRVKKRLLVLLVAAAFSVPKWRNALLRLADRIVF